MSDKLENNASDFVLGTRASDLWLYTCDVCANEKVIPKKYRYTTGTSLMNDVETICELIEGANLLDLRDAREATERLHEQKAALRKLQKLGRKINRLLESKQYPGIGPDKAAAWSKKVLTVRYRCAAWYSKDKERAEQTLGVRRQ